MPKAIVTKAFPGKADHDDRVRTHEVGAVIEGDLARVAIREGWADIAEDDAPETGEAKELVEMTLPELRDYARQMGIDLGRAIKKADVLAAIKTAQAANAS